MREKVRGGWRKLHDLYPSRKSLLLGRQNEVGLNGYSTCRTEKHRISVGKRKRPLGRPMNREKDKIKMNLKYNGRV
jgi:hypothetical protein